MNNRGSLIGIVFAAGLLGLGYVFYKHEQATALPVVKANGMPTLAVSVPSNNLKQIQQNPAPISGARTAFLTGLFTKVPGLPNGVASVPLPYAVQPTVSTRYPYAPADPTPSTVSILDQTSEAQAYNNLDNPFATIATEGPQQSLLSDSDVIQSLDTPFGFNQGYVSPAYGF